MVKLTLFYVIFSDFILSVLTAFYIIEVFTLVNQRVNFEIHYILSDVYLLLPRLAYYGVYDDQIKIFVYVENEIKVDDISVVKFITLPE